MSAEDGNGHNANNDNKQPEEEKEVETEEEIGEEQVGAPPEQERKKPGPKDKEESIPYDKNDPLKFYENPRYTQVTGHDSPLDLVKQGYHVTPPWDQQGIKRFSLHKAREDGVRDSRTYKYHPEAHSALSKLEITLRNRAKQEQTATTAATTPGSGDPSPVDSNRAIYDSHYDPTKPLVADVMEATAETQKVYYLLGRMAYSYVFYGERRDPAKMAQLVNTPRAFLEYANAKFAALSKASDDAYALYQSGQEIRKLEIELGFEQMANKQLMNKLRVANDMVRLLMQYMPKPMLQHLLANHMSSFLMQETMQKSNGNGNNNNGGGGGAIQKPSIELSSDFPGLRFPPVPGAPAYRREPNSKDYYSKSLGLSPATDDDFDVMQQ